MENFSFYFHEMNDELKFYSVIYEAIKSKDLLISIEKFSLFLY